MRITPKRFALGAGAAAVLAAGVAVPTVAFAQDPTPSPTSSDSATTQSDSSDTAQSDRQQRQAERQDKLAELLANELGISKDKVTAALDTVQSKLRDDAKAEYQAGLKQRLDDAVTKGTLTQEQEDAILAAAQAGVLGDGGPAGGPAGGFFGMGGHGRGWPGR